MGDCVDKRGDVKLWIDTEPGNGKRRWPGVLVIALAAVGVFASVVVLIFAAIFDLIAR